jgi:hypothetical protein
MYAKKGEDAEIYPNRAMLQESYYIDGIIVYNMHEEIHLKYSHNMKILN